MCNIIYERYLLANTKFNDCRALKLNNLCLPKDTFQMLTNTYILIIVLQYCSIVVLQYCRIVELKKLIKYFTTNTDIFNQYNDIKIYK